MKNNSILTKAVERAENLLIQRKKILNMSSEKALDFILDSPQSLPLVHSFPEQDLLFLINDIGPEDALPILSMASYRQWQYILDEQIWEKDRIQMPAITKWLNFLLRAEPNRLIRWFLTEEIELIELYLFKNIDVYIRDKNEDASDLTNEFFTLDDQYYIRISNESLYQTFDNEINKLRQNFILNFLKNLADYDHVQYQNLLFELGSIIPSEVEEEAYRMKNVRLAEKGFLPFEEALAIYQHIKAEHLKPKLYTNKKAYPYSTPIYALNFMDEQNFFVSCLNEVDQSEIIGQLHTEFAALCNGIISADFKSIQDKENLKYVISKACGYLSIGLTRLLENEKPPKPSFTKKGFEEKKAAYFIKKYSLQNIFQLGYTTALELKWKAENWRKNSWFLEKKLPLSFWGEYRTGVIGGLLIKRPLFYDNYESGVLYREFKSMDDIRCSETVLHEIMVMDDLFSIMSTQAAPVSGYHLTYKNALLSLWTRNFIGLEPVLEPIPLKDFQPFFAKLWENEKIPRKVSLYMKESFLNWLSKETGLSETQIISGPGRTLDNLFDEIENEYGSVSLSDPDPKYIHLFMLV
ncbi:conserved hypothetical protein [Candidatus Magnetomoraceae bacterium gMMP-15]